MKKINLSMLISSLLLTNLMATDLTKMPEVNGYTIAKNIKVSGEIRTRYEYFDDGYNLTKDANAFTNRFLFNSNWKPITNLDLRASFLNVSNFGIHNYSYENYGTQKYSYINEVPTTSLPELYLRYNIKNSDTILSIGKQKISFNNGRHIGIENWRQNYRTYRSIYAKNNTIENFELEFAYANGSNNSSFNKKLLALNGRINFFNEDKDKLNLTFYDFDVEDTGNSFGLFISSKDNFYDLNYNYRIEYSLQTNPILGSSNLSGNPKYLSLSGGIKYKKFGFDLGYTDQDKNYLTPYSSLNNFNGVLDLPFTASNIKTIEIGGFYDFKRYGYLNGKFYNFKESKSVDSLGNEFDLKYSYTIAKNLKTMCQLAFYKAKSTPTILNNDEKKVWLQIDYNF